MKLYLPKLIFNKIEEKCKAQGFIFTADEWNSSGFGSIIFRNLLVTDTLTDSLFFVNSGLFSISFRNFMDGKSIVGIISFDSVITSIFIQEDISGKPDSTVNSNEVTMRNYSQLANQLIRKTRLIPESIHIKTAILSLKTGNDAFNYFIRDLSWESNHLNGWFSVNSPSWFQLSGEQIKKGAFSASIKLLKRPEKMLRTGHDSTALAFLFDSLSLRISSDQLNDKKCSFTSRFSLSGLQLYHWRISRDPVSINYFENNLKFDLTENAIHVDSSSSLFINTIKINTAINFINKNSKYLDMSLIIPVMPAQAFFESLPSGLFNTFTGMKTEGSLSYKMHFSFDSSAPDSLHFESDLGHNNLQIKKFGAVNPYLLNQPFEYLVFEKGKQIKTIELSDTSPVFTPLSKISPYLINSVLISEDGSFYSHLGFNEDAFRQSIVTNIKEKRFARGGSTISMQLVKNLYLGRDKNISRKTEEVLWVWLIENFRMVSKDRLLEIYLNIIEWGPGIYGISEAADYYFKKKPQDLNLAESIFLAGIIPNPKYFKYSFDMNGNLRNYFQNFFKVVSTRLLNKEKITESEYSLLRTEIKLTGKASELIAPSDSLSDFKGQPEDSGDWLQD
ncbi:MAG: transglycosylase domain-containing protein [Bacteroidia bacterium]|nr:transglycosylase domain-containing protein [Bacteroidia bacterium]